MARPTPVEGLDADTPLGESARHLLAARLGDVRAHDAAFAGAPPAQRADPLHDLRVATRRLRAALRVFGRALRTDALEPHGQAVRALGQALGAVRDLDVFGAWIEELRAEAPAEEQEGLAALRARHDEPRATAEAALATALARFREADLLALEEALAVLPDEPRRFGGRRVRRVLARRLRQLEEHLEAALASDDAHTAHRLRILVKKLRYEAELLAPALPLAPLLDTLTSLQQLLGDLHDADVRLPLLTRHLTTAPRTHWPALVRVVGVELDARTRLATQLAVELRRWTGERLARAFRRELCTPR